MDFYISRISRDKYEFEDSLFSTAEDEIFSSFQAVQKFTQKINEKRDLENYPEQTANAGEINAIGLIHEIFHYIIDLYCEQIDDKTLQESLDEIHKKLGKEPTEETYLQFLHEFPALSVYRNQVDPVAFLNQQTKGKDNRHNLIADLLVLWLANENPAYTVYEELFHDSSLKRHSHYPEIPPILKELFDKKEHFGPDNQNLLDMLRSPAIEVPDSITGQLQYIYDRWGFIVEKFMKRLLTSLDFLKEEEKAGHLGPGPSYVYEYDYEEYERFSQDKVWMPNVVLIAKTIYVWLDQLSKKYDRAIFQLDHIPNEELDQLVNWGITGLWLIGLWERSRASKKIKHMCGNPEAEASAYSLHDYVIASDLGGEKAYENLRFRAWKRGIRLASDMVPNHSGIDSKWMIEHPDWFISQDNSPFPSYSFNGENLSQEHGVGIFLEDHYYNRTDAAVVFKRVDFNSGEEKYIYHGNDGTSMPWNDTAQLNYLLPEVRESVIQTILHVARKFPIIRFDAAMTLTKKHYQRLWFPEPGHGGDIPSRAGNGLTKGDFDNAIPTEFWREVVDRIAEEVPETLLLAEAFWLMEGYFVRTLGMHRVYNSAFMNMLKNEENAKYRQLIKNTLEFNPGILKRFVNFMNNPDEDTSIAQFGKDDKYFGICLMMVTMPGLPMIGHGQVEGFTEKYGMEYRKAYWDEWPDESLIHRHEKEIFPLLRKRYLFAEVENFYLYDFFTPEDSVNENVFAYSNCVDDERALIVLNNKFEAAKGWIKTSVAFMVKTDSGEKLQQKSLGQGLSISDDASYFCTFRDSITGLEYIRSSKDLCENGLYVELEAFKHQAFLDFKEIKDESGDYARLNHYLDGRGVASIEVALVEMDLQPLHFAFTELVNYGMLQYTIDNKIPKWGGSIDPELADQFEEKLKNVLVELQRHKLIDADIDEILKEALTQLTGILQIPALYRKLAGLERKSIKEQQTTIVEKNQLILPTLISGLVLDAMSKVLQLDKKLNEYDLIHDLKLSDHLYSALIEFSQNDQTTIRAMDTLGVILNMQLFTSKKSKLSSKEFVDFMENKDVRKYIQVNRHEGVLWYNKESFEKLLDWLFIIDVVVMVSKPKLPVRNIAENTKNNFIVMKDLIKNSKDSEFQLERLLEILKENSSIDKIPVT